MKTMEKNQLNTSQLNSNQQEAVSAPSGAVMVIAGPGSGKTFVITQRIHYMVEQLGYAQNTILVITFTKAAATEMKKRYEMLYGTSNIQFGTFHSVFFKILRLVDKEKYDLSHLVAEDTKRRLIEKLYKETDGDLYEDFLELFLAHMTLMKNQLIQAKYYNPDGLSKEIFLKVYNGYEAYKARHQLFDFDDMLVDCYYALVHDEALLTYVQKKYQHILIDEFQDINAVQFEIIKLIAGKHKDLFVVGDDDQSIYQFRGSKPEFLLSFEKHFTPVEKVLLDQNYRSTAPILNYSNALIAHNQNRYKKQMKADKLQGANPQFIMCEDTKDQAQKILQAITASTKQGVPLNECAIIYRTNMQARPIVETFVAAHIPFILKDSMVTLYDQWLTKDILAYLHASQDPSNAQATFQVINRPSRYISKSVIQELGELTQNSLNILAKSAKLTPWQQNYINEYIYHLQCLKNKPLSAAITYIRTIVGYDKYLQEYANYRKIPLSNLMDVLAEIQDSASAFDNVYAWEDHLKLFASGIQANKQQQKGVVLTTMHSAKGLEFTNVFILDVLDGVIPHTKSLDAKQLEEERRLLYVAMTRAKTNLALYVPKIRYQEKAVPSPFIEEMLCQQMALDAGVRIRHKHYGLGTILQLLDTKARIAFDDGNTRVIDYVYCIKQKLISREEDK